MPTKALSRASKDHYKGVRSGSAGSLVPLLWKHEKNEMKEVQLSMVNLFLGIVVLTNASAMLIFLAGENQVMERLRAKKQSVISCGFDQSINGYNVYYSVNWNNKSQKGSLIPSNKSGMRHSQDNREGNGCSHQPSVGALLCGSVGANRKLQKARTVS